MKTKLFCSAAGVLAALSLSGAAFAQEASEAKPAVPPVSAQTEPLTPSDPAATPPVNPDSVDIPPATDDAATTMASGDAMDADSPAAAASSDMTAETTILAPKDFMQQAYLANEFGIAAGQLALQKAESAGAKTTAQKMVDDGLKVRADMIAAVQGSTSDMQFDQAWDDHYKDLLAGLQTADGTAFDQAYLSTQGEVTSNAANLFESYASTGSDASVKSFASSTLPVLEAEAVQIDAANSTTAGAEG